MRDDNRKIIIFKGYAHLIPAEDEDELIKVRDDSRSKKKDSTQETL